MSSNILIRPINDQSAKDLERFIQFAWKIYEGNPYWVPPLLADFRKTLNTRKNSFFQNASMQLFLAEQNGEIVGRIAAIKNDLHNQTHQDKTGFFGFFETINDQNVANKLFDAAKNWLIERGMNQMQGPANPSINHEYGLLIEGFDEPPRIMMTYNPPYYQKIIETYGFSLSKNLLAFKIDQDKVLSNPKLERVANAVKQRTGVEIRPLNKKNIKEEVKIVKQIYNAAWRAEAFGGRNWGAIPLTDIEMKDLADALVPLAEPEMVLFAHMDNKPIGFAICLRDYNFFFKKANGRLIPFLYYLFTQYKKIEWARVVILGIIPEYQGRALDSVLYYEIIQRSRKVGIKYGEASWILEDNIPMIKAAQDVLSGECYKKYAIFTKNI